MRWRKAAGTVLFSPITVGMILLVGLHSAWQLPSLFCERLRVVRYLPLVGLCYYGVVVSLGFLLVSVPWWGSFLVFLVVVDGGWLLPDPFSFVFSPAKHRAVLKAIEFIEKQHGPRPIYRMVTLIGSEPGRRIISVAIHSSTRPPRRRFLAVRDDGSVEELSFEHVENHHGVLPWL